MSNWNVTFRWLCALIVASQVLQAQEGLVDQATPLPALKKVEAVLWPPPEGAELAARRAQLAEKIGNGAVLVFAKAPSSDLTGLRYRPDNTIYYLTGVHTNPAALLMVVKEGVVQQESLFLPPYSRQYSSWNGDRIVADAAAAKLSGIKDVRELTVRGMIGSTSWKSLQTELESLAAAGLSRIYMDGSTPKTAAPTKLRLSATSQESKVRHWLSSAESTKGIQLSRLQGKLGNIRRVKSKYEIATLQRSIDITGEALVRMMRRTQPGMFEFQIGGIGLGAFIELGGSGSGYAPIVGSGPNSCVLHYVDMNRKMEAGDLVLCDVGAEVGFYTADITRTWPVSGKWSEEQLKAYDTVQRAQDAAAKLLKPGASLSRIGRAASKLIVDEGYGAAVFQYTVGHHVGLYVHDPGNTSRLEPGCIVTIEPGIYDTSKNLGIRIEDMYLVTEGGSICLSSHIPRDPQAIEALMK